MPDTPPIPDGLSEPEKTDNANADARRVLAELDATVAQLAAEILGG